VQEILLFIFHSSILHYYLGWEQIKLGENGVQLELGCRELLLRATLHMVDIILGYYLFVVAGTQLPC
jgi:hypothetical protein